MQSRNVDLNSVSSNNARGFIKTARSASREQNSDDYVEVVLRKEINLWFQKNASSENATSISEPTKGAPNNSASRVINLGYSGD